MQKRKMGFQVKTIDNGGVAMSVSEGLVEVSEEKRGQVLILHIKGRLDAISSPQTEKRVFEFIRNGHHKLLLDFKGVEYLSSAGMRMLLSTTKRLKGLSGKLVLCGVMDNIMDVLKMSGFDHVLELYREEEDALKHLQN